MKTNKLFFGFLAAGLLLSCTNEDEAAVVNPMGNTQTSYIAINVNSAYDATRADYAEGTAEEQKVNNAHFFFFDNAGSAFNVSNEIGGTGVNYITKSGLADNGNNPENVETITEAVLTIKGNKGNNPAKVVAVVNWDYSGASLSLAELKAQLVSEADAVTGDFVMSNSVYLSGADVMDATPITVANISSSETGAMASPVDVYVERLAAKVALTQAEELFDTGIANPYGTGNFYVKVLGWDINTTMNSSNLVKSVSSAWTDANLGIVGWNIEAYKRSFWGESVAVGGSAALVKNFSWSRINNAVAAADYCLENTSGTNTKVLVKAQISDADGNPVEVVKLLGEYVTVEGLKNSIANALASKYYAFDGGVYTSIASADIELAAAGTSGVDSYTVTYRLTAAAAAKTWKVKNADGTTYSDVTADDVNVSLDALEHAQVWNDGMAYYFADIKHLGAAGTTGEFGVVRNHSYAVNVTEIVGLGTPVYDGDSDVEEPVTPSDTESYIAARINVLTWKLVNQNVILK
ncbi:MAG: Mfa1 fimbrilin C-terminal domain-containing protein [Bacteroidaceae bacterium]|nr:Mfa1 fimbrilin C-terminal domain-containing protein [Bacteroidaceae bacterium]